MDLQTILRRLAAKERTWRRLAVRLGLNETDSGQLNNIANGLYTAEFPKPRTLKAIATHPDVQARTVVLGAAVMVGFPEEQMFPPGEQETVAKLHPGLYSLNDASLDAVNHLIGALKAAQDDADAGAIEADALRRRIAQLEAARSHRQHTHTGS